MKTNENNRKREGAEMKTNEHKERALVRGLLDRGNCSGYDSYESVHGKAPRGYGAWGFEVEYMDAHGEFHFTVEMATGLYGKARDEVKRRVRAEKGRVYRMTPLG